MPYYHTHTTLTPTPLHSLAPRTHKLCHSSAAGPCRRGSTRTCPAASYVPVSVTVARASRGVVTSARGPRSQSRAHGAVAHSPAPQAGHFSRALTTPHTARRPALPHGSANVRRARRIPRPRCRGVSCCWAPQQQARGDAGLQAAMRRHRPLCRARPAQQGRWAGRAQQLRAANPAQSARQ